MNSVERRRKEALSRDGAEPNENPVPLVFSCIEGEGSENRSNTLSGEFDPGSERTLAAGLTHASRARKETSVSD